MKKIKVLFISHSSGMYGAEKSFLLLLRYLNRKNFEPIVIVPRNGPLIKKLESIKIKNYFVHCPEWVRKRIDLLSLLFCSILEIIALIKIHRIVKKEKIKMIYTNSMVCLSGAIISYLTNIPHITHIREFVPEKGGLRFFFSYKKLYKFIEKNSNLINLNSNSLANNVKQYIGYTKKLNIIHTPLDINEYRIIKKNKIKNIKKDDFVIACIGSLQKRKAQDDAIKAIKIVRSKIPDIKLIIVGEGNENYKEYLKKLIFELNVQNYVLFLGFREDIPNILEQTKILLMPSWKEPYGRIVLEAMASKVPIIGANSGGTKEQIKDSVTGYLVPPKNPKRIAEKIIYLYKNPKIAEKITENAKAEVIKENNPNNYSKKIEKTIMEALE